MALFGSERWLERGEAFSVYFAMFSSLAPLEVRDGVLGVRQPLSARDPWVAEARARSALVLLDDRRDDLRRRRRGGARRARSPTSSNALDDVGLGPVAALRLDQHALPRALRSRFVAGLFWAGHLRHAHRAHRHRDAASWARLFAHAFIPIALAYLVAHYFSLVVFQEQAQFTFLLSDPLGDGSDFFGTAGGGIDYGVISANASGTSRSAPWSSAT